MTGCPVQKVHKMKTKKREKLKKYLLRNTSSMGGNYGNKNKLQDGNGVSINTTPDYNFYKVLNPQKLAFKDEIMNQIRSNKQRTENNSRIIRDEDIRSSKLYEQKMRIVEHLQQVKQEKVRKSLRDDIHWQMKQKASRSFCG